MKAGSLNTLVTIQARQAGQDAVGQPLPGWTTFAQVWADVRHGNGLEAVTQFVFAGTPYQGSVTHHGNRTWDGADIRATVVCDGTSWFNATNLSQTF